MISTLLFIRVMYAARDITGTVGCLGLIVSSIISKKVITITIITITIITNITFITNITVHCQVAEGINQLVMDVKWGEGCYQETFEEAEKLADVLVQTSEGVGVKTVAVISHMESPLGRFVFLGVIT